MGTAVLYHGPGAEASAMEAAQVGRLLAPPFGADGLKVDEVREAVALLGTTPVGDEIGVVVIGPVDLANEFAADVLLKTLEDHDETYVLPVLWAHDLGNVSHTIQSRCLDQWSPGNSSTNHDIQEKARTILFAVREGDHAQMISTVQECKGQEYEILSVLAGCLVGLTDRQALKLWASVRKVLCYRNPRPLDIISALLVDNDDNS